MRTSRSLLLLVLLLLGACPRGEDPGPSADEPPEEPIAFPVEVPSARERIARYVHLLEHGRAEEVSWALAQLKRTGAAAVPAVARLLRDRGPSNPLLTDNALLALVRIGAPEGETVALAHVDHEVDRIRDRAIEVLGTVGGPKADDALIAALDDSWERVVARALDALGKRRTPGAAAAILSRRDRFGPGLLRIAAVALARLEAREAIPFLRSVVATAASIADRIAAARALSDLGDDTGLARLDTEAASAGAGDWSTLVAALLDAEHGSGRARVEEAVRSTDATRREEARLLRLAYPAIGRVDDMLAELTSEDETRLSLALGVAVTWLKERPGAIDAAMLDLLRSTKTEPFRIAVARILASSGRTDLMDVVRDELRDRPGSGVAPDGFAVAVGRAFGRAGPEGVSRLRSLLGAPDPVTAMGALSGIALSLSHAAADDVARLLSHPDRSVRHAAVRVLADVGTRDQLAALEARFDVEKDDAARRSIVAAARRILESAEER